jgi:YjbE family integral membrane protein
MDFSPTTLLLVIQIIWIDILLSGDNAVVIALACRALPERQRRWGILLGSFAAIALRIVFALIITHLLQISFLTALGGVLLVWIAVKLLRGEDDPAHRIAPAKKLWQAIGTIAMADAVMSLDNVVAISAASRGNFWLFVFGLAVSIPLIVVGAALITGLIQRFPIFVWAGAALLGWIGGEMIANDEALHEYGMPASDAFHYVASILGAALVVALGWLVRRRSAEAA